MYVLLISSFACMLGTSGDKLSRASQYPSPQLAAHAWPNPPSPRPAPPPSLPCLRPPRPTPAMQLNIAMDAGGTPVPERDYAFAGEQVARLRPIVANMYFTTAQVCVCV